MTGTTDAPRILRKRDQQPRWTFHRAGEAGFVRGRFNDMEGTNFSAGLLVMPFGQTTPLHSETGEHIIYLLEGEVEFTIEGEPYPLEPHDMLFIPAHAKYLYSNVGRGPAILVAILGKVDDWPSKGTYYN